MNTYTGTSEKSIDDALHHALDSAIRSVAKKDITFTVTKISGTYSREGDESKMIEIQISVSDNIN